jgi:hypothetical protein
MLMDGDNPMSRITVILQTISSPHLHWKGLDTLNMPVELYVQRRKKCRKTDEFRMATCEMCSLHIATADQTFDTLNLSFLAYNET